VCDKVPYTPWQGQGVNAWVMDASPSGLLVYTDRT